MSSWINVELPASYEDKDFENHYRAYIFNMPETGKYAGYTFAHPRKLTSYHAGGKTLKVREDWIFNLMKVAEPGKLDAEAAVVELPFNEFVKEFELVSASDIAQSD